MANPKQENSTAIPLPRADSHMDTGRNSHQLACAEVIEEVDSVLAFFQFALTGREYVEMNQAVQAGCDVLLGDVRQKLGAINRTK